MSQAKAGVGIVGGTGYGAGELLRLLVGHPEAEVVSVVSRSKAGQVIEQTHTHLAGFYPERFHGELDVEALNQFPNQIVFLGMPHGQTSDALDKILPALDPKTSVVIDLSGDYRIKSEQEHLRHYSDVPYRKELRSKFVYGLPELNRKYISGSFLIANPGCFATACILSVAPVVADGYRGSIIFDAKTGSSGAGRQPSVVTHHANRSANMSAYKVLAHRHEAEIAEVLRGICDEGFETALVPHLLPAVRGIFVTTWLEMEDSRQAACVEEAYRNFYRNEAFVRICKHTPELQNVLGTNFCDIAINVRDKRVVVMAALDNLGKGMASQAIQNMNLCLKLPEKTGLWFPALGPI